ncbi:Noc2-domain-containing protein [Testicularia cyperi]|uniref:Noc2-domain-containing protein n=1 Tax=Testicularia cyperi TaxID=1882483 RepID=A0A317XW45_9BASI|nr:Noc2-domain-containing protein [Testicularia cyperi]
MGKQSKSTKKFMRTQLDSTIKRRREHQKQRKVVERTRSAKKHKQLRSGGNKGSKRRDDEDDDVELMEEEDVAERMGKDGAAGGFKGMSVDDFLGGGFKAAGGDDDDDSEGQDDDDDQHDEEDEDDLEDVENMSDEEDEGMHAEDLEKLKEKDPEFYAYLQENDKNLLRFGQSDDEEDDEEEDEDESAKAASKKASTSKSKLESGGGPERVTIKMLAGWQKSMLAHRSLKALRRMLIAFRCAVKPEEEAQRPEGASYVVEDARVFNKLVLTSLKYTPVVLAHHVPIQEDKRGNVKIPAGNNKKWALIKKPIQSYFANLFQLTETLTEPRMIEVVVKESTRMVPYALCIPRTTREFVKVALNLWSSPVSEDSVRMSAFLTLRRLATSGGTASLENVLRGVYSSFVKSSRSVSVHTQPMLNLMKNTAVELFLLNTDVSYTQAFGFIRQLAIHLRNCIKTKSKDSFKAVLNWQFVSAVEFWSLLLSRACDQETERQAGESALKPLIYPLVQVGTGVVGMVPNSRYFPYRLHLLKSMLRIVVRTGTYIPLAPSILSVFESAEFQRKLKGSTSAPLDFSTTLRAPANMVRTRPYSNQVLTEFSYLLVEFLVSQSRSVAFPELVLPLQIQLKRLSKTTTNAKFQAEAKQILDKSHQTALWVTKQRDAIDFTPQDLQKVQDWELEAKENPLEAMLRLAKKVREKQEALIKAQAQVVGEDDDDEEMDDDDENEEEEDEDDDEELEMEEDDDE